jgi:hypothetical protein
MTTDNDPSGVDPTRMMLAYLCIATEKDASLETKVSILGPLWVDDERNCESLWQRRAIGQKCPTIPKETWLRQKEKQVARRGQSV